MQEEEPSFPKEKSTISAFVAALIGVVAAQASPGTEHDGGGGSRAQAGRSTALLVVSGIATGSLVWAALTAFGLGELLRRFPQLLAVLMFLGAAYLLWLAIRSLLTAWRGDFAGPRANADHLTPLAAWRRGVVVVLTNPKGAADVVGDRGLSLRRGAADAVRAGFRAARRDQRHIDLRRLRPAVLIPDCRGISIGALRAASSLPFGAAFGALGAVLLATGIRTLRF